MSLVRELEGRALPPSPSAAGATLGRLFVRLLEENRLRPPCVLAGVARVDASLPWPDAGALRALGLGDVPFFVGRGEGAGIELRLWVRLHKKRRLRKVELGPEDPCPP